MIMVPQLSSEWLHDYSTKTRQAGRADEQSMYPLMSMLVTLLCLLIWLGGMPVLLACPPADRHFFPASLPPE